MKPPSSLCLPPCQGRPEPVAVTEDRLLHILLFAQSLGALRSGTGAIWDEAALGNAAWSSLCCWCLWVLSPPSSKAGRLSPRDPPWRAASRKGALQPPPLCSWISSTLYTLPPFLFSPPFCKSSSQMSHTPLLQEMSHCPGASLIHVAGGQMDELVPQNPGGGDTESAHCL